MAERNEIYQRHKSVAPEVDIYKRRELCRVERMEGVYGGYRKDILKENLTERDEVLLICENCKGIMREASMSSSGEQFCSSCNVGIMSSASNIPLRRMISLLKCCCPLNDRGCEWLGILNDCEDHLDTCGYVRDQCSLWCGMVVERRQLKVHETKNCLLRKVRCVYCDTKLISYKLTTHLDVCPKFKVPCELKCGKKLCRENMAQHLK